MKRLNILMVGAMLLATVNLAVAQDEKSTPPTYTIDVSHSTLGFAVKHLGVGTTRGNFTDYTGEVTYDPNDHSSFAADVTIEATSIDTQNEGRDNHLRSADFFDVENHSEIRFYSKALENQVEGLVLVGDITIKGVTKTLMIPVTISGPVKSPFGGTVIALAGETTINRQDFNITWNKTLDNGGLVVADDVKVIVEIEANKK